MANAHRICKTVNCDGLLFSYYVYALKHTYTRAIEMGKGNYLWQCA